MLRLGLRLKRGNCCTHAEHDEYYSLQVADLLREPHENLDAHKHNHDWGAEQMRNCAVPFCGLTTIYRQLGHRYPKILW